MESNLQKASERLKEIRPDYAWDPSIFSDADQRADAALLRGRRRPDTLHKTAVNPLH